MHDGEVVDGGVVGGDGKLLKWWMECIFFTEGRKSAFMEKLRKEEYNIKEGRV